MRAKGKHAQSRDQPVIMFWGALDSKMEQQVRTVEVTEIVHRELSLGHLTPALSNPLQPKWAGVG